LDHKTKHKGSLPDEPEPIEELRIKRLESALKNEFFAFLKNNFITKSRKIENTKFVFYFKVDQNFK